ncbi:hypothetical protein CsSME_00020667 [Camellia sinensis var. sinensis]
MVLGLEERAWGTETKLDPCRVQQNVKIDRDTLCRAKAEHVDKQSLAHADYGVGPGLDERVHRLD